MRYRPRLNKGHRDCALARKLQFKPRIKLRGAYCHLELTIKEDIEIKPGQIWTLVAEIDSAISAIMRLQIEGMTAPRDKPVEIHISTSLKK